MIKPISYSFHAFVRNRKISKLCRKNHLHLDIWGEYFVDDSTQSFWIIFEVGCNCYKIDQVHLTQFRSNFDVKHMRKMKFLTRIQVQIVRCFEIIEAPSIHILVKTRFWQLCLNFTQCSRGLIFRYSQPSHTNNAYDPKSWFNMLFCLGFPT